MDAATQEPCAELVFAGARLEKIKASLASLPSFAAMPCADPIVEAVEP